MEDHSQAALPMLREIVVGESAYRALERRAAEAEGLRARVESLGVRLTHAHREIDSANHFLETLLVALDDLERADAALRASGNVRAIADGVALVRRALEDSLARAEIREIGVAVGDRFDLAYHDLAPGGATAATARGVVRAVLRRGWQRQGEVVRRTLVEVEWEQR